MRDIVDSGIGLSYWPASLQSGLYSSSQGLRIATAHLWNRIKTLSAEFEYSEQKEEKEFGERSGLLSFQL